MQVQLAFHHFNVFATWLTEVLWYLDVENKTGFFICTKETKSPLSIMHVAVRDKNVQAVKFCIEYLNIDKNPGVQIENISKGKTPLHLAAQLGNLEIVQLIKSSLNLINPIDERGWSVIHLAASNGHLDIVKEIAKDLDQKDPKAGTENWTPLHLAAIQGYLEIVKYLHEVGSDMCITEKNGWNALDLARQNNHYSIVVFLCQYPLFAAINKVSRLGNFEELRKLFQELNKEDPFDKKLFVETSPLHEAAKGGHVNILDFFQNNLPSMSILDSNGKTALHCAAEERHLKVVKYLGELIDIDIEDKNGETACDIAKRKDYKSISEYLDWLKSKPVPYTPVSEEPMPSFFKKLEIKEEEVAECPICTEPLNDDNWGILHTGTIHSGYCENCLKTLKNNHMKCPECRASIEAVVKVH